MFICFIGLQNAGLSVDSATLVGFVNFKENFHTAGICALLAVIGLMVMAILYIRKVPGSILIGIFGTWLLGILCELVGIYQPDPAAEYYSLIPSFAMTDFSKLSETVRQCFNVDFGSIGIMNFIIHPTIPTNTQESARWMSYHHIPVILLDCFKYIHFKMPFWMSSRAIFQVARISVKSQFSKLFANCL